MKIGKIKIQGTLPKMGVWLPTLLAMHAQTNLNQGLFQVPHSPPLSSPSHPKRQSCRWAHLCSYKKRSVCIKCDGGWER